MQVWHYSMQLSFILFLFFYSPHSQWLFIGFFCIFFFQAHLIPVEHPLKQTPPPPPFFTLTLHSDVYNTSLVWRRVCLSDSGRRLGRALQVPLPRTHMLQPLRKGMYLSNCFHVCFIGFYWNLCFLNVSGGNKNGLDFLINMSNGFFSFLLELRL